MKTIAEIIVELQTVLADLQALQVPSEPVVSVETMDAAGATETFVPEAEPVVEPTA